MQKEKVVRSFQESGTGWTDSNGGNITEWPRSNFKHLALYNDVEFLVMSMPLYCYGLDRMQFPTVVVRDSIQEFVTGKTEQHS